MTQIVKTISQETVSDSLDLKTNYAYFTKRYKDKYVVSMSGDGILLLDGQTLNPIRKINTLDGLSNNYVASLIVDDDENIWLPTFMGITILDEDFNIQRTIHKRDGLSDREFNGNASIYYDGKMYLGSTNGVTIIKYFQLTRTIIPTRVK